MGAIRAKVVCVLWSAGKLLLIRATDPEDGSSFLLPPGGGVEFGEKLEDAVRREVLEEVGTRLSRLRRRGMIENFFRFSGEPEHELIFVYEAESPDPHVAATVDTEIVESNGQRLPARWYTPAEALATQLPVYPEGLFALLESGR